MKGSILKREFLKSGEKEEGLAVRVKVLEREERELAERLKIKKEVYGDDVCLQDRRGAKCAAWK